VLIVDETGDRKDGNQKAHVGRQYLGNRGKIENGVVSVSSLWADERVYYPLAVEPYPSERWFAEGKADPAFRTKPQIALELVDQALAAASPIRAVVADCLYGDHRGFTRGLQQREVPYVGPQTLPCKEGSGTALPWPRPWRCWPLALRRVRAWLDPALFLWRCWRAWSTAPPPSRCRRCWTGCTRGTRLSAVIKVPLSRPESKT
jgi:hypothetical protein